MKGKEVVKDDETNDDIEEDEEIQILAVTKSIIATSTTCTSFLQTESDGFAWINESVCKFGNSSKLFGSLVSQLIFVSTI